MGADRAAHAGSQAFGRPRATELRSVLDAILYIARTGCQWRMLPKQFSPFTTVQGYFYDGRDNGLFETINFHLLLQAREVAGRDASPSAGVIRQSISQDDRKRRAARWSVSSGAAKPRPGGCGQEDQRAQATHCDRYRRSAGRCRGAPADVQDRDGAVLVIEAIHQLFLSLRHLFADSVYNGPNLSDALGKFGNWTIEIVKTRG
jgi:transposase